MIGVNEQLFDNLTRRKKAIGKWKQLQIMLVLKRLGNGKTTVDELEKIDTRSWYKIMNE